MIKMAKEDDIASVNTDPNSLAGEGWPASPLYLFRRRFKRTKSFGEEIVSLGLIAQDDPTLNVGDELDTPSQVKKNEKLSILLLFVMEAVGIVGTMLLAFCSGIFVGVLLYHPTVQVDLYISDVVWNGGVTISGVSSGSIMISGRGIYEMSASNPSSFPGQLDFGDDMVVSVVPKRSSHSSEWVPIGFATEKKDGSESIVLTGGDVLAYQFCFNINASLPLTENINRQLGVFGQPEVFRSKTDDKSVKTVQNVVDTGGCWDDEGKPVTNRRRLLTTNERDLRKDKRRNVHMMINNHRSYRRRPPRPLPFLSLNSVAGFPASMVDQCEQGWMLISVSYPTMSSWCFGGFSDYPDVRTEPFTVPCQVLSNF